MDETFNEKPSFKKLFWDFYVCIYSHSGIEEACVCLQNKYQLNSNILLFCCWLARENYRGITNKDLETILQRISPWHSKIIEPLSYLFRAIPHHHKFHEISLLRDLVAENILLAKKLEQTLMLQMITPFLEKENDKKTKPINKALSNIFTYINNQHTSIHKTDLEKIHRIVKTTFLIPKTAFKC